MRPTTGFDLDLTLVDTRERILASAGAAFADLGVEVDRAALVPHLGVPLAHKVAALAPGLDVDAFVGAYRRHYNAPDAVPCAPMPGARAALEAVHAAGGRAVVVSAKAAFMAREAVAGAGLGDLVDVVVGDAFGADKAVPLRAEGAWLYVGDHPADVAAGHGAGAFALGVATGAHDEDALTAAGADAVVADLHGFAAAADRLRARRGDDR